MDSSMVPHWPHSGQRPSPFRPAPAAFGTYKLRGRLCHIADNTDILGQSFSEILRGAGAG